MKIRNTVLATLAACGASAQAITINFDELSVPYCCTFPAQGYQGFDWNGGDNTASWVISNAADHFFTGTDSHSGRNYAWSNGGTQLDLSVHGGGTFDFNSLWTRAGYEYENVTVTGYSHAVIVGTETFGARTEYEFHSLNFDAIDDLKISTMYGNLLIDDITVNANTAVPEPSDMAMVLAGLGLTVALARRRNTTAK